MNRTNFEHAGYALLMQMALWPFVGPVAGGLFAIGFFLGREHSQREEIVSPHNRDNPFPAFKIWEWEQDEQLDFLFPVIAVLSVAIFMEVK
ncbi:MAG TPA: hypothetical protein PKL59_21255 [Nitrospira sp.]|nr:hypothetical protein [Nitrospira sp.]HNM20484.1 hypothetical protein [Nitrospira sp.]